MKAIIAVTVAAIALASPALAKDAVSVPAQPVLENPARSIAVLEPAAPLNILRASTPIPLITREELTTKKKQLRVGQRIQMEVASNVELNGVIVIPAGTPAVGELTEVRNKGMWGKSGYINARILSLRLGDRQVRLSGTFDDKGVTGTAAVVTSVALIPLVGFFTTGTSASIPSGSAATGFLEEDIAYRTIATPPVVIDIPTPAPASTAVSIK